MSVILTKNEARNKIANEWSGKIFTITFIKRSTGEKRVMNCRTGVRKHAKGEELRFNPAEHNLKSVFDMQKREYCFISLEGIKHIKMGGKEYKVI